MENESPRKHSAGPIICGMFSFLFMVFLAGIPGYSIQDDMNPVFKEARPYKTDVIDQKPKNNFSGLDIRKREHIFHPIIHEAADRYKVDAALVKAIIMAESGYNPTAISKRGAVGLMQLMPATAGDLGVDDLLDPVHNIDAGVKYFKRLLNQFNGDLRLALAAYNAGSRKVKKYQGIPPFKSTHYFIQKVFKYYQFYQGNKI